MDTQARTQQGIKGGPQRAEEERAMANMGAYSPTFLLTKNKKGSFSPDLRHATCECGHVQRVWAGAMKVDVLNGFKANYFCGGCAGVVEIGMPDCLA